MTRNFGADYLKTRLHYDPKSGRFRWLFCPDREKRWNTRYAGRTAGTVDKLYGYVLITLDGKTYRAHRLAWLYMTGEWPPGEVDHRNRKRDENWWDNLRLATSQQQSFNSGVKRSNTLGVVGVKRRGNRYHAEIRVDGRKTYLGSFATKEEAGAAYAERAKKLRGEFACD